MTMHDQDIETLLGGIPEPADNGFSARVMSEVIAARAQRVRIRAALLLACMAVLFAVLTLTAAGEAIIAATPRIIAVPQLMLVAVTLVLGGTFWRAWIEGRLRL